MAVAVPKPASPYARRPEPFYAGVGGSRGVPALVSVRATALADLHDELHSERAESVAFATHVAGVAGEIHTAIRLGNEQRVMERAGYLSSTSLRFIGRRSGGVLAVLLAVTLLGGVQVDHRCYPNDVHGARPVCPV